MTTADDTLLKKADIQQRMRCSGRVAHNIEKAFVTVESLVAAVESDDQLTEVDNIGPKGKEVIMDWYRHRERREQRADETTITRTSSKSATITFHTSWADALTSVFS